LTHTNAEKKIKTCKKNNVLFEIKTKNVLQLPMRRQIWIYFIGAVGYYSKINWLSCRDPYYCMITGLHVGSMTCIITDLVSFSSDCLSVCLVHYSAMVWRIDVYSPHTSKFSRPKPTEFDVERSDSDPSTPNSAKIWTGENRNNSGQNSSLNSSDAARESRALHADVQIND